MLEDIGVNLLDNPKYSDIDPECSNQLVKEQAIDVKDRERKDFIWQFGPWNLYSIGNPQKVYPGIDFLLTYWMGEYYNFLNRNSGKCFRYKK
jgi:hypothetical protein